RSLPVRAARILLRRSRLEAGRARLQPDCLAARHVGEDLEKTVESPLPVEYRITQYELEQGALEIQYIEEFFGEFPRKKAATEIIRRLKGRAHLILLATAPLPDDPGTVVPVSFKVAHEIGEGETEPKLADLVNRLRDFVQFDRRKVLYTWIGGTRR